jgi:hypothetical protein
MLPLGIETKIVTIPNPIRPSSAQNSVRAQRGEVSPRGVAVGPAGGNEPCGGSRRLPQGRRVGAGVFGDERGDRQAEQQPKPEQQPDRKLLAALRGGDVQADDACERGNEQDEAGRAAQIAAEVGAERRESDRDGDVPHDLARQLPSLVTRDRLGVERRPVNGGPGRAHVTTTTGRGRRPQRSRRAKPPSSTMWS